MTWEQLCDPLTADQHRLAGCAGKQAFATRGEARAATDRMNHHRHGKQKHRAGCYKCRTCLHWHLNTTGRHRRSPKYRRPRPGGGFS